MDTKKLFEEIDRLYPEYLDILEDVVRIESPTNRKDKVDEVGRYFIDLATAHGWTDSDSAGAMIRNHINNITRGNVEHVYIPPTQGKEKRKATPSKEGLLGVEGIELEVLRGLFERFEDPDYQPPNQISRERFYSDGYSGTDDAKARRERLAEELSLPKNMSSKALLSALNMLVSLEEYERITEKIK